MKQEGTQGVEGLEDIAKSSFKVEKISMNNANIKSQEMLGVVTGQGKKRSTGVKLPLI